jgi:plasmid maintenance system antidote protein VapI
MSRRAYIYFALTFLLGVIVGGACVYYYAWSTGHWHRPFNRQIVSRLLKAQLNLSDTQVFQLEQILEGSTKNFRAIQQQMDSQSNALREETRNRIRQILSQEQVQKFDELVRRWDERRQRLAR